MGKDSYIQEVDILNIWPVKSYKESNKTLFLKKRQGETSTSGEHVSLIPISTTKAPEFTDKTNKKTLKGGG